MSESISDKALKSCVMYVLNLLMGEKDDVLSEIRNEILGLSEDSCSEKKQRELQNKIEKMEDKKVRLIDLRLSGEITSYELEKQKEHIDTELENLQNQLEDLQSCYEDSASKIERIQSLFAEVERLLTFQADDTDEILGSIIDTIKVLGENTIEVYLKDIPMGFKITYHSTGKLSSYRTEIKSCEII